MKMKFYDVFTPGSPPHTKELLVGRQTELEKLKTHLKSQGIHPIVVVGPRGIGKTSLVQFILDDYNHKCQIEANTVNDFDELTRCILDDLDVEAHKLIQQTCKYTGVRFLDFIRSKEQSIDKYCKNH